jgi:hypothetical protein
MSIFFLSAILSSISIANPTTDTSEVCQEMHSSYIGMAKSVATLSPFETGEEFAILRVGDNAWYIDYSVDLFDVDGNIWNDDDWVPHDVPVYIHPRNRPIGNRLSEDGRCIIQYRRYEYRGNNPNPYEVGRYNVLFSVVEPVVESR